VPRNLAQLVFPLIAALSAAVAPGAALVIGAASYGAAFLAGLRLTVLTRRATGSSPPGMDRPTGK
jgi:hypothetical protein